MVVDCSSSFKHKDLPPNPHPWSGLLFAGRGSSPDPAAGREDSKSLPQHGPIATALLCSLRQGVVRGDEAESSSYRYDSCIQSTEHWADLMAP